MTARDGDRTEQRQSHHGECFDEGIDLFGLGGRSQQQAIEEFRRAGNRAPAVVEKPGVCVAVHVTVEIGLKNSNRWRASVPSPSQRTATSKEARNAR